MMLLEDKQKMLEKAQNWKKWINQNYKAKIRNSSGGCLYCIKNMSSTRCSGYCEDCKLGIAGVCYRSSYGRKPTPPFFIIIRWANKYPEIEKEQALEAIEKIKKVIELDIANHDHEAEKVFKEVDSP